MAGLSILRRLLMKQAMKESAPFQDKGIMSISRSLSSNVDAKVKRWAESAKRQGQDLDKMSEQELKYLIELNKPQAPKVYSNEEAYEILNRFANKNKRGEVIKADFGKSFADEVVTVESVITDIKKLQPIEAMKEANRVLRGEGRYKTLSKADREKIAGDESVTDHIFERNIIDETEDFEQGGRVPLFAGKIVKEIIKKGTKPKLKIKPKLKDDRTEIQKALDMSRREMEYDNPASIYYDERRVLQDKYPGITDDLLDMILADNNPQRKAEVLATIDEAFRMLEKGKGPREIIQTFQKTPRTKQAQGGPAGLSYLLAEDTNERMPLGGGGYLPLGMWGDIAEAFEKYQEENKDSVGPLMSYKQFWNNYIDNLASGGRVGYAGGGSGKPPINFYVDFSASGGKEGQNIYGIEGLNEKGYDYGGTFAADTTFPFLGGELSIGGELGIGRDKSDVNYKGQPIDFLSNVSETKIGDNWNVGAKWRKPFAGGGMGRRAFLKLMAAIGATGVAAKSGLVSLLGKGPTKQVATELTKVPIKAGVDGMPAWFKPLVNKVIKEGTEIPSGAERVIVHKTKLPNSKTDVYVEQDLNTGDVVVDIGSGKHGWSDGYHGQPVRLQYKAKEVIEPDIDDAGKVKSQGKEVPEEFNVEEAEFTGGHPENVKFEESTIEKYGDHGSDFSEVEKFATGKVTKSSKAQKDVWEADWDDSLPDYEGD
jgi:hypothetical protein